ncbi:RNA exonuclease 4 [Penicillium diatomitis]|uniref:RNA exonuclease 4 n=1 Tax=Penicillium diatomitis TaxID=2819901 RepID=A0A9W9X730_9EURO|nr:RNA exonuclease 4 [Penicillium diatomitis]KAJ5485502.1 RNA exonuclease 4 [Penicillium diatomitis]
MDASNLSSNWKTLQATLKQSGAASTTAITKRKIADRDSSAAPKKRKIADHPHKVSSKTQPSKTPLKKRKMADCSATGGTGSSEPSAARRRSSTNTSAAPVTVSRNAKVNEGRSATAELGKYIAMDCEMVGVGPNPDNDSVLARVSIVNFNGDQIYDSYVRPKEMVTDWRTHVSGIAPKHMVEARTLEEVQKEVGEIMNGRILVGHALSNDLDALLLSHPKRDIRDTSKHAEYRKIAGGGSPRLKMLAEHFLGLKIQDGAHSSVEDARATMALYRREKDAFEKEHLKKWPIRNVPASSGDGDQKKKKKKKKTTRKR